MSLGNKTNFVVMNTERLWLCTQRAFTVCGANTAARKVSKDRYKDQNSCRLRKYSTYLWSRPNAFPYISASGKRRLSGVKNFLQWDSTRIYRLQSLNKYCKKQLLPVLDALLKGESRCWDIARLAEYLSGVYEALDLILSTV